MQEPKLTALSRRAYQVQTQASSWEEIWEAGPYFTRIASILENAEHYAIFAGWQIDSRLPLPRPGLAGRETLRDKVIRLCEEKPSFQFYFLIWDHAYFYVVERERWQARIWEDIHPRVHFVFDNRHPFGASHHEKACVIDGKVALCGGIDLCDERWDTPEHRFHDRRRSLGGRHEHHGPYHDLAIQVTGEVCAEVQNHIGRRWKEISDIPFPEPPLPTHSSLAPPRASHRVYVSRTMADIDAERRGSSIIREVEFLFRDLIASARHRILLEGQYYWSREINDMLIARMLDLRGKDFEIVLVLAQIHKLKSLSRQMASYELELLDRLIETAQVTGARLTLGTPYVLSNQAESPRPVYIHSKAVVIDDRFLSIGSANLAARALRTDTEISLTLEALTSPEREHIRKFADRLLAHWHLTPGALRDDFQFRSFRPRVELGHHSATSRLPIWRPVFDPELPWFYFLKRRARNRRGAPIYSAVLAGGLGISLAWILSGTAALPRESFPLPAALSALLASAWWFRIPFLAIAVLAFLSLPERQALFVVLTSFWSAALLGYSAARMFPRASARRLPRLPLAQGALRNFSSLISFLVDPRISLNSKVNYPGLHCVPFPWYALAVGVVLSSATTLEAAGLSRLVRFLWARD